jgi:hypothetical protein
MRDDLIIHDDVNANYLPRNINHQFGPRAAMQADIDRLERIASIHSMTRRILRRMVDFPQAVPVSDETLKFQHDLLRKMCDLIENGHIKPADDDHKP